MRRYKRYGYTSAKTEIEAICTVICAPHVMDTWTGLEILQIEKEAIRQACCCWRAFECNVANITLVLFVCPSES